MIADAKRIGPYSMAEHKQNEHGRVGEMSTNAKHGRIRCKVGYRAILAESTADLA